MKTWTSILAAGAILALAAPVANGATSNIPGDATSGYETPTSRVPQVIKPAGKKITKKKSATAIKVGQYGQYAYVPGGSSPSVAKAITAQGQRAVR